MKRCYGADSECFDAVNYTARCRRVPANEQSESWCCQRRRIGVFRIFVVSS